MSDAGETVREAAMAGKNTHGAQASVGRVHPAHERLDDRVLEQLRNEGLVLPRTPREQEWRARTEAELHLLREAYRLDRVRQLLLGEVGRLRQERTVREARRERLAAAARTAERMSKCPLSTGQLTVLAAAAAGERQKDTARRLLIPYDTIRSRRLRIVKLLAVRSFTQAVAVAVAAGWITGEEITGGVAP